MLSWGIEEYHMLSWRTLRWLISRHRVVEVRTRFFDVSGPAWAVPAVPPCRSGMWPAGNFPSPMLWAESRTTEDEEPRLYLIVTSGMTTANVPTPSLSLKGMLPRPISLCKSHHQRHSAAGRLLRAPGVLLSCSSPMICGSQICGSLPYAIALIPFTSIVDTFGQQCSPKHAVHLHGHSNSTNVRRWIRPA